MGMSMDGALQLLTNVAGFIAVASLKGTLLLVLILLARALCNRWLTAQGRFLLWIPAFVSLVLPFGFEAPMPAMLVAEMHTDVPASSKGVELSASEVAMANERMDAVAARTSTPDMQSISFARAPVTRAASLLPYIWLTGFLGVLGSIAFSFRRFTCLLRRATEASPAIQELLIECAQETRVKISIRALESADCDVPLIAGVFRPVLLLPLQIEHRLTRAQLRHVLIHELMHLRRGDIVINWLTALVQALHWFNPCVWYAAYSMRHDRELACDASTLRHLAPGERAGYGRTLLEINDALVKHGIPPFALGMLGSASQLESRIRMIVRTPHYRPWQSGLALSLLLMLTALAFGQPVPGVVEPVAVAEAPSLDTDTSPATREPPAPVADIPVPVVEASAEVLQVEIGTTPPAPPAVREVVAQVPQPAPSVEPRAGTTPSAPTDAVIAIEPAVEPILLAALEAPTSENRAVPEMPQPEPAASDAIATLAATIRQVTDTIATMKPLKLRFIEEWDAVARECAASKDASLFGLFAQPCRDVRTVQRSGDVFRFVYACKWLERLQAQQLELYQGAILQRAAGIGGLEQLLQANAQETQTFCGKETLVVQYPGFNTMYADAEALKYFNPLRRPWTPSVVVPANVPDPSWMSRMTDMR